MEVLEAIGKRRSIRFYKDWKKVEDWKIQVILQAARYESCQGNCNSTEAIVIDKATYPKKKWDEIVQCVSAFNELHLQTAPTLIVWLTNLDGWYKDLVKSFAVLFPLRAISAAQGWTYKLLTETTYPRLMSFPKDKTEDLFRIEAGQAMAQSMLAATELGLGTCLIATGRNPQAFPKVLGLPENVVPLWAMTVGYPLEDPDQRPRKRFDRLFHFNGYGKPLKEDKETKELLKEAGMILDPNPIDEREQELKNICRSLGLTEDMPDMPKEKIKELYKKDSPYYGELPKDLIKKGV